MIFQMNFGEKGLFENDMSDEQHEKRKSSPALKIVFFAALAVFVISGIQLIRIRYNYHVADSSYEELREEFMEEETEGAEQTGPDANSWLLRMHEAYPEIVGWVRIPDSNINYPIMYHEGEDGDEYYLTRNYSGEQSVNGSIFLETMNSPTLDDVYSIIYGHNMNSGAMFHDLNSYMDQAYWEGHPEISLLVIENDGTSVREETWQIFSAHRTRDDSEVYTVGYIPGSSTYKGFVKDLTEASNYDTGISPSAEDRILTLSTCTSSGGNTRTVVHAVLVSEED